MKSMWVLFLALWAALVAPFAATAESITATEYISNECSGQGKDVVFAKSNTCITVTADLSLMTSCDEMREYPNPGCEGAPVQVRKGCFASPTNPSVYITLSCMGDVGSSDGTKVESCNSSNEQDIEDMEDSLPFPVKDFETSYDEASVIIPVQTSAAGQLSLPYGLMAFLATFFVIF